jgi:hypothetical protein
MITLKFLWANDSVKKLKEEWPLYVWLIGMLTTASFVPSSESGAGTTALLLISAWIYVPVTWLIMAFVLDQCFARQLGKSYSIEEHQYVFTNHRKWKFMLWIAPISLPCYALKAATLWIIRKL